MEGNESPIRPHESEAHAVVTPGALVISLTPEQQAHAEACLKRSETVRFEIRASDIADVKQPSITRAVVAID